MTAAPEIVESNDKSADHPLVAKRNCKLEPEQLEQAGATFVTTSLAETIQLLNSRLPLLNREPVSSTVSANSQPLPALVSASYRITYAANPAFNFLLIVCIGLLLLAALIFSEGLSAFDAKHSCISSFVERRAAGVGGSKRESPTPAARR